MKKLIIIFLFSGFISCKSGGGDKNSWKGAAPSNLEREILIGEIHRNDLLAPPHHTWFNSNFDHYRPLQKDLDLIIPNLSTIDSIKVFMGTWCIDSKREVPKLFKILKVAGYELENVSVTGLELDKKAPKDPQEDFGVVMIPTIIFYKQGKELNRFVEYPRENFEKDIAKIVSEQEYRHSYFEEETVKKDTN